MSAQPAAPIFCKECEQRLIESLPAGQREFAGFCAHHNTLAQVSLLPDGTIRVWRLRGPIAEIEAAMLVQISAGMKKEIFGALKKNEPRKH